MKNLIIYHDNCDDGLVSAWCFWKRFGNDAEYLPLRYNENFDMSVVDGKIVYILDFSFSTDLMLTIIERAKRVVWLDHHISALSKWRKEAPSKYWSEYKNNNFICHNSNTLEMIIRTDVSGAMLSWLYTNGEDLYKEDVYRSIAPRVVQYTEDNDLWRFTLPNTEEFVINFRSYPRTFSLVEKISKFNEYDFNKFIDDGKSIKRYFNHQIEENFKNRKKIVIDGQIGLACNASFAFTSNLGHKLAETSGSYGVVYFIDDTNNVRASLRSSGEYDVSKIALKYGGGGHKNSAGFSATKSEFFKLLKSK